MTSSLPGHASPVLAPLYSPQPASPPQSDKFNLSAEAEGAQDHDHDDDSSAQSQQHHAVATRALHSHSHDHTHTHLPSLISPAFTPPATPGFSTPSSALTRPPRSIPVDTSSSLDSRAPDLLETLPVVECEVRARIPTTQGHEMWLHVYRNNVDTKEHLAIVFGNEIRSKSLDAERAGETEMDRMTRGAYVGRLFPGRTSSRAVESPSSSSTSSSNRKPVPETRTTADATPESQTSNTDTSALPLVRIHSECYTGETIRSARCDCGEQLDEAARLMSSPSLSPHGGAIIYLRQEGRGIGLGEKLKAYNLQDLGNDTYEANIMLRHPADARSYGLATAMLVDLGLGGGEGGGQGIRLLTNNPDKVRAVEGPNKEVRVRERVAMVPLAWRSGGKVGVRGEEVERYLSTKVSLLQDFPLESGRGGVEMRIGLT